MLAIPQSVTRRIVLKAYLSSDHVTAATGKTIAVVISKNGAAFGNPSGGATNATEIANGWYYVDLSTTDSGTLGPLIVRGTASGVDDAETWRYVVDPHNAGYDGVPSVTAGAISGLPLSVDASGRVDISQTAADKVFGASGAALAELGAVPSATPSPRNALMLLFMTLRNKLTTTATAKSVFNDAGSSIASKALSDDGTTYTETKMS